MLMVVVLHSFTMPAARGVETFEPLISTFLFFSPLRVPVLFALSGMLLAAALTKPFGTYMSGKIRNLVWPLIVWNVLTALAYLNLDLLADAEEWIGGVAHLWFLSVLGFCFAVGWAVKVVPAWVFVALFPLLLMLTEVSNDVITDGLFYGTFFFVGTVLWRWRNEIRTMGAWLPILCVIVGIAGCFVAGDSPIDKFGVPGLLAPLPWFFAIMWLGPRLRRVPVLESIGRNSVIWYCAHFPAVLVAVRVAQTNGLEGVAVNIVVLAAGILVPLALVLAGKWARPLFFLPSPTRRASRHAPGAPTGRSSSASPRRVDESAYSR